MGTQKEMSNEERFLQFHKKNPHIYKLICHILIGKINKGAKRISTRAAAYEIRENLYVHTTYDQGYKIANAHTPYYAKMFLSDYPQHEDKITIVRNKKPAIIQVAKGKMTTNGVTKVRSYVRRKKTSHIPESQPLF